MPFHIYRLIDGVFATTDIEPASWSERWPVTPEQEVMIRAGANLVVFNNEVIQIDPIVITEAEIEIPVELAPEPPPEEPAP